MDEDFEDIEIGVGVLTRPCGHGNYVIGFLATLGVPEAGQYSETTTLMVVRNVN